MRDYNDEFVADVFKVVDSDWVAVDSNGSCYMYEDKPHQLNKVWEGGFQKRICQVNLNGQDWRETLRERPKVVWVPRLGDMYYVPDVISRSKYDSSDWSNDSHDRYRLERGLVNQTPEQAIAMTDKILEFVKNLNEGK